MFIRLAILLVHLTACGTADQSGESSLADTGTTSSTDTSTSTSTTAARTVPTETKTQFAKDVFWSIKAETQSNGYINTSEIPLELSNVDKIRSVRVFQTSFCGGTSKDYPYAKKLKVSFSDRNTLVSLGVKLVGTDDSLSDCKNVIFWHDDRPPTANRIKIEADRKVTNLSTVELVVESQGGSEVYITDSPGCRDGGYWERTSFVSKQWSIPQKNAINKFYAKFRDFVGNVSECVETGIVHDDIPPKMASINIAYGAASTTVATVDVSLFAIDAVKMSVGHSCASEPLWTSTWIGYSTSVTRTLSSDGAYDTLYATFVDEAGNKICVSDSINTPETKIRYYWYEGSYFTGACNTTARDYTVERYSDAYRDAFTVVSQNEVSCALSGSKPSYECDYTENLKNCTKYYNKPTGGFCTQPVEYRCTRPSIY